MQPNINDLAIIGDQRTCALIDKNGCISWYCPNRFDKAAIFSLLVDETGGFWNIEFEGKKFIGRHNEDFIPILTTTFTNGIEKITVTDWMPAQHKLRGLCRKISASSNSINHIIVCKPVYGEQSPNLHQLSKNTILMTDEGCTLYSSHILQIEEEKIICTVPAGETSWFFLSEIQIDNITAEMVNDSLINTKAYWKKIMGNIHYQGVYQHAFYQSYLAIQLMTHAESGGILAAGTTSLPEVPGGSRNYDYRYVWLRDTAMVVSALIRAESKGGEAEKFLDFLCETRTKKGAERFIPMYDIDGETAPPVRQLNVTGYQNSQPVVVGNNANEQLQLDANGNVLLAAKQVYQQHNDKPHWVTVRTIADYLAKNWNHKDHGIWEENTKEHFTSSKVIVARSLEFIAEYADDAAQKNAWLMAAKNIRAFITTNCMTNDGAYAVFAGSQEVDITASLFAVWMYDDPGSDAMQKTIERIEKDLKDKNLYHRNLLEFDEKKEGVFLAGSLWMGQHYVMLGELEKAKTIIDACLQFSTDLGFIAEEGNVIKGDMLGNFPQTFVHASLMGVILDYNKALKQN